MVERQNGAESLFVTAPKPMITKQAKAGWIGLLGLTLFTLACPAFGETETYDWTLAASLYPGVKYAHYNATVPNGDPRTNQINCVQIDTTTPNLRFYAAPRYSSYVENLQETSRQTTRNFITTSQTTNQKVVAAINGNGYTVEGAAGSADLTGFAVSEGVLVSPGGVSSENPITRSSFIVNKQGNASIVPTVPYGYNISNVQTAVSGFITDGICLSNGTPIGAAGSPEWHDTLNPRTGIGISQDSRYVYFITIDGRQSGVSEGAYVLEVGSCLKYFGSYNGLNMDGGGSSTMAWWNPGNSSSELLNVPVGLGDVPGTERSVGINIGVCYVPEPPGADVIYHDSFARGGKATPLLLDNSQPQVKVGHAWWIGYRQVEGKNSRTSALEHSRRAGRIGMGYTHGHSSVGMVAVCAAGGLRLHVFVGTRIAAATPAVTRRIGSRSASCPIRAIPGSRGSRRAARTLMARDFSYGVRVIPTIRATVTRMRIVPTWSISSLHGGEHAVQDRLGHHGGRVESFV